MAALGKHDPADVKVFRPEGRNPLDDEAMEEARALGRSGANCITQMSL